MKKMSVLLVALAMVFGMNQCKKNVETIAENTGGMNITLHVDGDDGGSKIDVDPTTGIVAFKDGDIIYVASNGVYVGKLTRTSGTFTGKINGATVGEPLYFYFLGNKTPSEALTEGSATSCTISIEDQRHGLPVISSGVSSENLAAGTHSYTTYLYNKCGLVKFATSDIPEAITITGMNNTITVDFSGSGSFSSSSENGGNVILNKASNTVRWAILPVQSEVTTAQAAAWGYYMTDAFTVPAVTANMYSTTGVAVPTMNVVEFTVSAGGKKVRFSPGILQYQASTTTWRFAEHQYDYVGEDNKNISSTYAGWIDLFGWGASGYNNTTNDPYAMNYQPWSHSTNTVNETYNKYGYGPSTNMTDRDLVGTSANYDWGVYNAINNPTRDATDPAGTWRLLTSAEWNYLFTTRTTSTVGGTANARYAQAIINTDGTPVKGVILFPDSFTIDTPKGVEWSTINAASNWLTRCTCAGWKALENAGCVFLAPCGYRSGTSISYPGTGCRYWSSTAAGAQQASNVKINGDSSPIVSPTSNTQRDYGRGVRLVRTTTE